MLSVFAVADLSTEVNNLNTYVGTKLTGTPSVLFKNERANLYIKMNSGEEKIVSLVTEDKVIKSIEMTEVSDPTIKISTTEEILNGILTSNNPNRAMQDAFKEGKITYQAVGFGKKVKLGFVSFFARVGGWFSKEDQNIVSENKTEAKESVPEVKKEEPKPEEAKKEEIKKEAPKKEEKPLEAKVENSTPKVTTKTYTVNLEQKGFNPVTLKIKKGDTVVWKVTRSGNLHLGMILGVRECAKIKSQILDTGASYQWTFDQAESCTIVDGVTTTQTGSIVVE